MKNLIVGHVSNKLLLTAYFNEQDTFYVNINDKDSEDAKECFGKPYMLENIILGRPENTELDQVYWDEDGLSIDDVELLNEFLEVDKPAYLGKLYCEELEQLLEYEPFLGNSSYDLSKIKEKEANAEKHHAIFTKYENAKLIDYIDYLLNNYDRILVLGDFQKLVPDDKVIVYKPTDNVDEDIKNIKKIFNSYNIAYIPNISNRLQEDNYVKLNSKISEEITFEKNGLLAASLNSDVDCGDYDIILEATRYPFSGLYCEQYRQVNYGYSIILDSNSDKNVINVGYTGLEHISNKFKYEYVFSEKFRTDHSDYYDNPKINKPNENYQELEIIIDNLLGKTNRNTLDN